MPRVRHGACDACYYDDDDDDDVASMTETGMAEKSGDRRRLRKSAFCSNYREIELATRENVVMLNVDIAPRSLIVGKTVYLPATELDLCSPGD